MQPYIFKKIVYYDDKRFKLKMDLPFPKTVNELYSEAAGLPSIKKIKADIEKRRKERENISILKNEEQKGIFVSGEEFSLSKKLMYLSNYQAKMAQQQKREENVNDGLDKTNLAERMAADKAAQNEKILAEKLLDTTSEEKTLETF